MLSTKVNTDVPSADPYEAREIGGDHYRSTATFLTQSPPVRTDGPNVEAGTSLDQIVARRIGSRTPIASLQLSIEPTDQGGGCLYGYSCLYTDTLSWASPTTPLPMNRNPRVVFDELFGVLGAVTTAEERQARRRDDRSILDWLGGEITRLSRDLGAGDRVRLSDTDLWVRVEADRLGAGESLVAKIRSVYGGELYNMYGPTETTIWSTAYRVEAAGVAVHSIPIGRPILNTHTYVLDERLQPVPVGEVGEFFIGGDGVVRGYWHRPELTAQKFLHNPYPPGGRIYRTGDLARCLPDGHIEFLGRADFQIKLRGYRIEPGEIEAVLERLPGVRQAVVVAREDKKDDKRLVASLTASGDGTLSGDTLRGALAGTVPE